MTSFGILIKQSRENRGLTVRALADAIGKSPGYISRIEVRGEIPSVELVVELADEFAIRAGDTVYICGSAAAVQRFNQRYPKR